ncbi:lactadherin-like [Physella acuta]|uniref:lactadherin-like n=1 Tax=Physella acuta TaxID=109671 RepID=UPI0027DDFA81|nr:lactadherin-like [Physella acuta]
MKGFVVVILLVIQAATLSAALFDACDSLRCLNMGFCTAGVGGTVICVCPVGFTGVRCEIKVVKRQDVDPCHHFTCLNGGSCFSPLDFPYCHCPVGVYGEHCELSITAH